MLCEEAWGVSCGGFVDVHKMSAYCTVDDRVAVLMGQPSMEGSVMKWFLMLLILSLMLVSTPVSAQQPIYILTVPVYQSVPASLTRMREVLKALNATFKTDASLGDINANLGSALRSVTVQSDGTSIDRTTIQPTRFNVTCVDADGGAEVLCRDIKRRYEK